MKSYIIAIAASLCASAFANDVERARIVNSINNDPSSTWRATIHPQFAGKDYQFIADLCGVLEAPAEEFRTYAHHSMSAEELASIPDSFDSREEWDMCDSIKEIRDQSRCGSCWAFGAVEAASDRICIATKGALQTRISSESLVGCCYECGMGCEGGYPSAAWDYMATEGLPSGGLYGDNDTCAPYSLAPCDHHVSGKYGPCAAGEADTPDCPTKCGSDYTGSTTLKEEAKANKFKDSYYVGSSVSQIQKEIMSKGPVEAAFSVYADFPTYTSGVYQHKTGSMLGGHAIKIIGWGVEDGTPYWTVVNSWNEGWGDNGTFKILRGNNECGIEDQVVAGTFEPTSANLRGFW